MGFFTAIITGFGVVLGGALAIVVIAISVDWLLNKRKRDEP